MSIICTLGNEASSPILMSLMDSDLPCVRETSESQKQDSFDPSALLHVPYTDSDDYAMFPAGVTRDDRDGD